jgi:hypothetical protein
VAQRPAVKPVIGTMVNYLRSVDLPVPEFGERENIR